MDWQIQLIRTYLILCDQYEAQGHWLCQRLSNNPTPPEFSDVEVLTVYLFGITEGRRTIKACHDFAKQHMTEWFPKLPSYQAFVARLNELADLFPALIDALRYESPATQVHLIDSFPIMMANSARSSFAKVAPELGAKGYCATKKTFYYGIKLHVTAQARPGQLPLPRTILVTAANVADLVPLRAVPPETGILIGDKAYLDQELRADLARATVTLVTPIKKRKGQETLPLFDQLQATSVSRIRQPIESFFNWINEKTGLQQASKVRSTKGLLVHVFGRFAAAMLLLTFNS